ncbi:hypothetical protein MMC10_004229 [Thelotrema lepadinum]|nr:hypothetical protein [Thelotrema lepadinum]
MSEPQPLWTRYSCLPAELRDQIHGYNLVSSRPVCIEATEDGHLKYQWREYPEVANKMLSQAMKFYVWSDEGAHSNEALAYLLSHNTLIVQNKTSAKALVSTNQSLSKAGYSAYPLRIKVQVPPDPYVNWLETGDDDDIERNHQIALDDNDFETGDRRRLGLRAFRILSPLTKLSRLHEIQVILQWNVEMDEDSLVVVGRENPAIRMFGAVIAKLKNLVAASSNGLEFKVIEIYQHDFEDKELDDYYYGESSENEDDAAVEKDLTWVWNAPSEEECRRMKKHAESRKKADAMRVRIWEMNRAISNCHGHFKSRYRKDHGAKLGEEKERLETQVEKLMSQIQGLPPTEQCSVERCYVSGLAADPNWEKAVEIIAKQRPPSSDRWRPSTVRELEEDSFWWMRM